MVGYPLRLFRLKRPPATIFPLFLGRCGEGAVAQECRHPTSGLDFNAPVFENLETP